jgi:hypothetical protein
MEVSARIEQAVSDAVAHHLETELGTRGLLLAAADLALAETEAARLGARLLTDVIQQCYSLEEPESSALGVEFASEHVAPRLGAALAFGAATAQMLAPDGVDAKRFDEIELICATFNLGIGLVDGVCDDNAAAGVVLLETVGAQDLASVVDEQRGRGWLRAALPSPLARDYTVAFTVEIIEVFFELLHDVYPADAWSQQRRRIGTQLASALDAEHRSLVRPPPEELLECSRLTSVLPFEIIEALARNGEASSERSAATLLGEAMWHIDDLVDLGQDARSGALNGVLLEAAADAGGDDVRLEQVLATTRIASAAAEGAESLRSGLQLAGALDQPAGLVFLSFIQRYAGIAGS